MENSSSKWPKLLGARQLPIDDFLDLFDHHWLAGAALGYASITEDDRSKLDSGFREAAEKGLRLSAVELLAAQVKRAHFGAAMDVALNGVDVVISPATAHLPFATAMKLHPIPESRVGLNGLALATR
ncbi:hypothetical protein [Rhizobium ruizarguesonis]|uniref:hypothetical protein n=1 Tax=Rhizobium ruizarguesonis TaxID=2081791 RepID=UPI0010320858|nr:hypothetical protein [Rhizobium ruizarguesonis]TBC88684.1 hypothetical protein ELH25_37590 [Rhizobium ruizarguesonis]TBD07736.1 hypothetical protein ELH24_37260 [Rhizobium ruizarguesonis]TBD24667.1 hypothetical protein ELH18_37025 [Rhizobium ruizarguesonis]TBD24913.1 hypothetical protein ELH19_36045 [Rhizobium ruizarguesonis]TBD34896.1 hypothetical protein ELH17_33785 [Rhizobium ruizarguesonis]